MAIVTKITAKQLATIAEQSPGYVVTIVDGDRQSRAEAIQFSCRNGRRNLAYVDMMLVPNGWNRGLPAQFDATTVLTILD